VGRRVRKMGREERNTRKRRRTLEEMVNTCEMNLGNQYTHKFLRWHVDFMLRACCRGVGEVRDEENYWNHVTYLESHLYCKFSARGGGGVGDGGGRVQDAFVWLSTKGLREISQSWVVWTLVMVITLFVTKM
jgi:hypothetical protein